MNRKDKCIWSFLTLTSLFLQVQGADRANVAQAKLTSEISELSYDSETGQLRFVVQLRNMTGRPQSLFNPFNQSLLPQPLRAELVNAKGERIASWDWQHDRYDGSRRLPRTQDWILLPPDAGISFVVHKRVREAELDPVAPQRQVNEELYIRVRMCEAMVSSPQDIAPEGLAKFWSSFSGKGQLAESTLVKLPSSVSLALSP